MESLYRLFGNCRGDLPDLGERAGLRPALSPKSGDSPREIPENLFILAPKKCYSTYEQLSKYFGAEVRQTVGIQDAFRKFSLSRFRSRFENLQIQYEEEIYKETA